MVGGSLLAGVAWLFETRLSDNRSRAGPKEPVPGLLYRPALSPGVALLAGGAPAAGFLAFGVLYARDLGIERWSFVPFTYAGTVVLCRIVFAKLPDRVPSARLAIAALGATSAGLVSLGLARHPAGLIAAAVLIGLGTALLTPSIFALVFSRTPAHMRGSAAATTSIFIGLGVSGGPVFVGLLAAAVSVPTAFLATALLPVGGALVLAASATRGGNRTLSARLDVTPHGPRAPLPIIQKRRIPPRTVSRHVVQQRTARMPRRTIGCRHGAKATMAAAAAA